VPPEPTVEAASCWLLAGLPLSWCEVIASPAEPRLPSVRAEPAVPQTVPKQPAVPAEPAVEAANDWLPAGLLLLVPGVAMQPPPTQPPTVAPIVKPPSCRLLLPAGLPLSC
jgi:hypothetical protein